MTSREILNIQIGNFSNYVGAHWLNAQAGNLGAGADGYSEFDGNVLWRRRYGPRLITIDFKNNYGTKGKTRKEAKKISEEEEDLKKKWNGKVERIEEESDEGEGDDKWTSLIKWNCQKVLIKDSPFDRLDSFSEGQLVFAAIQEEFEDSVRLYAEECDFLQGMHVVCDQDGFSGTASCVLEHLSDEYASKTRLCFGLGGPSLMDTDFRLRTMNAALLLHSFDTHSSIFTSLSSFHNLFAHSLQRNNTFPQFQDRDSELFGLTLDSFTSAYCLNDVQTHQCDVAGLLKAYGRKLFTLGGIVPFDNEKCLFDRFNESGFNVNSFTPSVDIQMSHSVANFIVPRAITFIQT